METSALPDLAAARRNRGLSLDEIAHDTKIRAYYLNAIEQRRFEKLPGGVYSTSYIRQYARAIAYDEAELLAFCGESSVVDVPEPIQSPKRGWGLTAPFQRLFGFWDGPASRNPTRRFGGSNGRNAL